MAKPLAKATLTPPAKTPDKRTLKPHELVLSPTIQSAVAIEAWSKFAGTVDLAELVDDLSLFLWPSMALSWTASARCLELLLTRGNSARSVRTRGGRRRGRDMPRTIGLRNSEIALPHQLTTTADVAHNSQAGQHQCVGLWFGNRRNGLGGLKRVCQGPRGSRRRRKSLLNITSASVERLACQRRAQYLKRSGSYITGDSGRVESRGAQ